MTYLFLHLIICIIMHLLLFLSPDWLTFCHIIISLILLGFSLWRRANARNVRLYYPNWQYTNIFIFRFVSQLYLRSTLRLSPNSQLDKYIKLDKYILLWKIRMQVNKGLFNFKTRLHCDFWLLILDCNGKYDIACVNYKRFHCDVVAIFTVIYLK